MSPFAIYLLIGSSYALFKFTGEAITDPNLIAETRDVIDDLAEIVGPMSAIFVIGFIFTALALSWPYYLYLVFFEKAD